jgi:hypothetical protein
MACSKAHWHFFMAIVLSASMPNGVAGQGREAIAFAGVVASGTFTPYGRVESGAMVGVALETQRCLSARMRWGLGALRLDAASETSVTAVLPSFSVLLPLAPQTWTLRPHVSGSLAAMITSESGTPLYLGAGVAAGVSHGRGAFAELAHDVFAHEGTRFRAWVARIGWSWRVGSSPSDVCS